ncbi:glycosyl hydrolase family 18 protein [Kitasatospora sp. NPDC058478]|uniref:glycosyl hydrolase family 18 protein n=1 Tax=unclassified Kitasatospora TaxID=2633591 RepID=UPI003667D8BF
MTEDQKVLLQADLLTTDTYEAHGYKPEGTGTALSYTSTRVCVPAYNGYDSESPESAGMRLSAYLASGFHYDGRLAPERLGDASSDDERPDEPGYGFDLVGIPATAYDRIVFGHLAVLGDVEPQQPQVAAVRDGWNSQTDGQEPIGSGHVVPVDPFGDLGVTRNVDLPASDRRDASYKTFLAYYNQEAASGVLGGLRNLQQRAKRAGHKLELAFSITDAGPSGTLASVAGDAQKRAAFTAGVVDFFNRFPMFSEVELAWDSVDGKARTLPDAATRDAYALVVRELRQACDRAFGTRRRKSISIAVPAAGIDDLRAARLGDLVRVGLDSVSLKAVDFFRGGEKEPLGHLANLTSRNPDQVSAQKLVEYLVQEEGIHPGKIHLGYACYGRAVTNADPATGTHAGTSAALGTFAHGVVGFYDAVANYLDLEHGRAAGKNGFALLTDQEADADTLLANGHYISLDTPRSVMRKGKFAATTGLGGLCAWSAHQDNGLLANAAREGLGYVAAPSREFIPMAPLYNPGA